jgi:hypothetical protein
LNGKESGVLDSDISINFKYNKKELDDIDDIVDIDIDLKLKNFTME